MNEENVNWNVVGDNQTRMILTIPVCNSKKWWQFWNQSDSKKIKKLISEYKKEVKFMHTSTPDIDYFIPTN